MIMMDVSEFVHGSLSSFHYHCHGFKEITGISFRIPLESRRDPRFRFVSTVSVLFRMQ